ncbi:MAG: lysylphosphatidylglycerol synthase transmembrane domain-containing protein [Candidatus Anammoxibacter sp.]
MKLNKKSIIIVSGIIISLVCTWLFARHIEWGILAKSLKGANYSYVIPAILASLLAYVLRAMRWQSLISPIKKISLINLFSAISIGYMANHILPARIGEIIRPAMIGKKENIKITSALTTVVLERIFDLLGLLVFTVVILILIPSPNRETQTNAQNFHSAADSAQVDKPHHNNQKDETSFIDTLKKWIGVFAGAGVAAIAFLFMFIIIPEKITKALHKVFNVFPEKIRKKLEEFLVSFIAGLQILGNKKHLVWILFLTIAIWILTALSMYILAFSFNLNLSFTGSCLVAVCLGFAVALPQAPGYIGLFHLATQKALEVFNIEMVASQSYAISLWAISIIPITIIGILFLWKEGVSLKDLSKFGK